MQRSLEKAQSERDAAKAELSKVNSVSEPLIGTRVHPLKWLEQVKQKLEVLCKELQKQNKDILERSKLISEEEQASCPPFLSPPSFAPPPSPFPLPYRHRVKDDDRPAEEEDRAE